MAAFSFAAPVSALIFDQAAKVVIPFEYTDSSGAVVPLSGYGARLGLYVDESALLLLLTVGNGKIVVSDTLPNLVATIDATDTAFGTPINGFWSGSWYLYLDPNGVVDADSFKSDGGGYTMNKMGPT